MSDKKVIWQPQPRQLEFMSRFEDEALYGGSAGGGKSDALVIEATRQVHIPHYKGLILRKTFPQLTELIDKSQTYYPKAFPGAKYNEQKHTWTFPSGAKIIFGSMQYDKNKHDYQGKAYDFIAFDELTHFTYDEYIYMLSRNRPNGPGTRSYMRSTANPGGIGHQWVKERFIDAAPPMTTIWEEVSYKEKGKLVTKKMSRVFIPSTVFDNQILLDNDPSYLMKLAALPEAEKNALLYGDWNSFSGMYFGEFRSDLHIIEPIPLPKHYRRYRAIDYGLDMLAVLWMAVDDMGNEYIYRELHLPNIIAPDAARMIAEASVYDDGTPEEIERTFAPPDLWSRTKDSGRSIADLFAEGGVRFTKASAERINGWMMVKDHIKPIPSLDGEGETSRLKIFRNCVNLIKNIQLLEFDDKRPSDASTEPHEITHICLTGDTVVRTPRGNMRLDEMDENGVILAYSDGEIVEAEYDHLGVTNAYASVYAMELDNGEVIRATENHPFLTEDGYKALEDLNEGDTLVNADGGVNEIVLINYDGHETVYNMSVDTYHNFITAGGTVTHNCDALRYMCVMRTLPAKPEPKEMTRAEWLQKAKQKAIHKRR